MGNKCIHDCKSYAQISELNLFKRTLRIELKQHDQSHVATIHTIQIQKNSHQVNPSWAYQRVKAEIANQDRLQRYRILNRIFYGPHSTNQVISVDGETGVFLAIGQNYHLYVEERSEGSPKVSVFLPMLPSNESRKSSQNVPNPNPQQSCLLSNDGCNTGRV